MSKPVRAILLCMLFAPLLFAHSAFWLTWPQAKVASQKSQKLILLKIEQDGCHYCEDMERKVFKDAAMQSWIKKAFEPVSINVTHQKVPLGLSLSITPSFYIIAPDMSIKKFIPGSWSKKDFKSLLTPLIKDTK